MTWNSFGATPQYFKRRTGYFLPMAVAAIGLCGAATRISLADTRTVFAELNGLVAVEAEHFAKQSKTDLRAFYLTTAEQTDRVQPDGDPAHLAGASAGAYLEVLPDTRRTHDDKLIKGTNFAPEAGQMAVLDYKVHFSNPGRYYVWVRAFSTGTEDNGLHVGLNGEWPESGQRLQWCEGKRTWRWESKQRTAEEHCGEPYKIYLDIDKAGEHTIHFAMREDGFEFDKWLMTRDREFPRPAGVGPKFVVHSGSQPPVHAFVPAALVTASTQVAAKPSKPAQPLFGRRAADGDGKVSVSGELKQWHKVTLTCDGPFAHEQDTAPNPFIDYRLTVEFRHQDGTVYRIPGYFAADGDAANSSAQAGTTWRAHFAPDRLGKWDYTVRFIRGDGVALDRALAGSPVEMLNGKTGSFDIAASNKSGRDLRSAGRLQYVGGHYLQFAGNKRYFLKAGADAPETLLGYADFDNTVAGNPKKVPLKTWAPHVGDWRGNDPTWQNGKGKGLIGAINYLSAKGCNAFSFLTYNAGGDGDNVWPFIARDEKLHYDCSKLDQWAIVFEHGTRRGMYLHFKLQETENDDNRKGHQVSEDANASIPTSLDGGQLGTQRKLYCRELIARFAHNLALNWNLGEENTQSSAEQRAMLDYIAEYDAYGHNRVVHTFPDQQDRVYGALLGDASKLTGVSLQNSSIDDTHWQTVKWAAASQAAGKPWVVAFDESGTAAHGQCPDLGYRGFDGRDSEGKMIYTEHEVRHLTLWATLMAGGAGVEYYFGYRFAENDLVCEDWRSRDRSWDYCRIALEFFEQNDVPFWQMRNRDELIGNAEHDNSGYCLAQRDRVYVVYAPQADAPLELDLSGATGEFEVRWYNPRIGGELQTGSVATVAGGGAVALGNPPADADRDWTILVRRGSGAE